MEKVRYMISDAAQMIDVESHVLRYWEEELELKVPRNELGHRYYTQENIEEFQKIKDLKEKGYQLKAIKMVLQEEMPVQPKTAKEVSEIKVHTMPKAKTSKMIQSDGQASQPVKTVQQIQGVPTQMTQAAQLVEQINAQPGIPAMVSGERMDTEMAEAMQMRAEEKMEQFQNLMTGIVKKAIQENNQALGVSVGEQVGEKVLKEMNYLMREQEELAEEHYHKLDEAIRHRHKSKKLFRKEKDKALQPKTT